MLIRISLAIFLISSFLPVQNNVTWIDILQLNLPIDANTNQPMQWSPDSQKIIAYMLDGTIERNSSRMRVYEVATGNVLLDTAASEVNWQWHPNSELIAIWYSNAPTIEIWSLAAQQPVAILQGYTDLILQADWSPNGVYLATYSQDKTLKIWDSTGNLRAVLTNTNIDVFVWSPMSDSIAYDGKVWKFLESNTASIYSSNAYDTTWSPNGEYLAIANGLELQIWEVSSNKLIKKMTSITKMTLWEAKWNPNGTLITTRHADTQRFTGYLTLWDFESEQAISVFDMPDIRTHYAYGWDKEGNYCLIAELRHIYFWDKFGQKLLFQIDFDDTTILTSLTHDGKYFAETPVDPFSENRYHEVHIWDIELEQQVATLHQHEEIVTFLQWSPDGNYLASADYAGNLIIWQKTVGVG